MISASTLLLLHWPVMFATFTRTLNLCPSMQLTAVMAVSVIEAGSGLWTMRML